MRRRIALIGETLIQNTQGLYHRSGQKEKPPGGGPGDFRSRRTKLRNISRVLYHAEASCSSSQKAISRPPDLRMRISPSGSCLTPAWHPVRLMPGLCRDPVRRLSGIWFPVGSGSAPLRPGSEKICAYGSSPASDKALIIKDSGKFRASKEIEKRPFSAGF